MAVGLGRGAAAAQPRPAGIDGDIWLVYCCAGIVFLIGLLLAVSRLLGLRLSRVFVCETLLGAFVCVWHDRARLDGRPRRVAPGCFRIGR